MVSSDVVERMTDTAKYTGAHKHRFDEEGKGRGLEGRDSVAKGRGMVPGSVASQTAYVPGYKHEGTYSSGLKSSPKSSPHSSPKPKPKVGFSAYSVGSVVCMHKSLPIRSLLFVGTNFSELHGHAVDLASINFSVVTHLLYYRFCSSGNYAAQSSGEG